MKTAAATDVKNRFGQYLRQAEKEPVVVEVSRRPTAVILSHAEYERLIRLEDDHWAAKARRAEKSGFVGPEESVRMLREAMEKDED